ncbi:hypothetical protein DL98DRAFT_522409 [Cadophora sp. DSE1049]|nr:hypothetical protein DL98DRAFT_522409 [Cadophora sp. DSE1049]
MHHTLPTMLALQALYTSTAGPYQPTEEYCDFCSTSPCSCGWAEDYEPEPGLGPAFLLRSHGPDSEPDPPQPRPDSGGGVGCMISPSWPVLLQGPARPQPGPRPTPPQPIKKSESLVSPFWPAPRGVPARPRPIKKPEALEDRDQPQPPPPNPLPPMLPPNPYPS